ncbi:hypothetical protein TGARI_294651A, partial [Toxoplasma gondii ARI]
MWGDTLAFMERRRIRCRMQKEAEARAQREVLKVLCAASPRPSSSPSSLAQERREAQPRTPGKTSSLEPWLRLSETAPVSKAREGEKTRREAERREVHEEQRKQHRDKSPRVDCVPSPRPAWPVGQPESVHRGLSAASKGREPDRRREGRGDNGEKERTNRSSSSAWPDRCVALQRLREEEEERDTTRANRVSRLLHEDEETCFAFRLEETQGSCCHPEKSQLSCRGGDLSSREATKRNAEQDSSPLSSLESRRREETAGGRRLPCSDESRGLVSPSRASLSPRRRRERWSGRELEAEAGTSRGSEERTVKNGDRRTQTTGGGRDKQEREEAVKDACVEKATREHEVLAMVDPLCWSKRAGEAVPRREEKDRPKGLDFFYRNAAERRKEERGEMGLLLPQLGASTGDILHSASGVELSIASDRQAR